MLVQYTVRRHFGSMHHTTKRQGVGLRNIPAECPAMGTVR